MEKQYIPRTIHYVWVGGNKKPPIVEKCIQSWKNIMPEYEIIEWNESNFNIDVNEYVRQAYGTKKYAFVSDYIRFYVLYYYGGIYLDTDVEVIRSLDPLLYQKGFVGFENDVAVNPGLIIGAIRESEVIKKILDSYQDRKFINSDESLNTTTVVKYTSDILEGIGFKMNGKEQIIDGFHVYPTEYFCPLNYKTREKNITSNTYTIHHYVASWIPKRDKIKKKVKKKIYDIIGDSSYQKIKEFMRGKI